MAVSGTSANVITHVIFDLDGLLIDSETLYTKVNEDVCQQFGKHFTLEVKRKQMGRKPDEGLQILIDELQLPVTVENLRPISARFEEHYLTKSALLPGVNRLLDYLSEVKIPMCIASGSEKATFGWKMHNHGHIPPKMSHILLAGSDPEVRNGKPAPDCFIIAASRFTPQPKSSYDVLVFEDSANGVLAAIAAHMRVVWVPNPAESESAIEELRKHPNVTLLHSLTEFSPELFGLPPFSASG